MSREFKPVDVARTTCYNNLMQQELPQNGAPLGPKAYDPSLTEEEMYSLWEEHDVFKPVSDENAAPFSIVAPPPNANGALHVGHAVYVTLQDLVIRYHRMKGDATLWLPGYDHAGFETQVVYEKKLEKEGRSRFDLPRKQLYKEMYEFTQANIGTVRNQLKKLGASLDWSREMFTLDPRVVKVVYQTFKTLYDDGLIYRGERPVNWCARHQTSLSDLEAKYEERQDAFYYLKYGPFTIGTARPETKFGDKYVVMHPSDDRYKNYEHGQKIELEWINGPVTATVIKDEAIDMAFGTGVMTITPWHDPLDFEIAKRHNLDMEQIIDKRGKLLPIAGEFADLHISKARPLIVEKLKAKGLLEKVDENYRHNVQVCYKCNTLIEPQVMPQWFVAMTKTGKSGKNLRDDARAAVRDGKVSFVSEKFSNQFHSWMENLYDWNISRQIVWGIQLPVWYCRCSNECTCPPIITDGSTPEVCPECGHNELERDTDVFDTWFSSGQWPFAALLAQAADSSRQIANSTEALSGKQSAVSLSDFQRFYPSAVMETGYDILFFWVARMIMLGLYVTDDVPFRHVYLHGLVRDKDRQKMSKSKGNVIDPLGVAEQYGSDAVRMALVFGTSAGNDIIISEDKIRGMRNFANKLWNISRFALMNLGSGAWRLEEMPEPRTDADKQILHELDKLVADVTDNIERFQFHIAAEKLYDFIWHAFADTYIEASKLQLQGEQAENTKLIILLVLQSVLKLLHPFMPFITEAIYQSLPIENKTPLLATSSWPT